MPSNNYLICPVLHVGWRGRGACNFGRCACWSAKSIQRAVKAVFLIAAFVSYRVLYMRPLSLVDRVFLRKCAVLF